MWSLSSYVIPVIDSYSWTISFTICWKGTKSAVAEIAPKYTGIRKIWRNTWYCGQSFPQKMHTQSLSQGVSTSLLMTLVSCLAT